MQIAIHCFLFWFLQIPNSFGKTNENLLPKNLSHPVIDEVSLLTQEESIEITNLVNEIRTQNGPEIGIVIIDSLKGEPIEDYSIALAEKWKLGTAKEDNGLIIIVALKDRQLRVEVGNGIEGIITDQRSSYYTHEILPKFFKTDAYSEGLKNVLYDIANQFNINLSLNSNSRSHSSKKSLNLSSQEFKFQLFICFMILSFASWLFPKRPLLRGIFSGLIITIIFLPLYLYFVYYIIIWFLGFIFGALDISSSIYSGITYGGRSGGGFGSGGFGSGGFGSGGFGSGGFGSGGFGGGGGGFSGGGSSGRW